MLNQTQIIETIADAKQAKAIYNVDYKVLKDSLNGQVARAFQIAQNVYLAIPYEIRGNDDTDPLRNAYYGSPMPHVFMGFSKKIPVSVPAEFEPARVAFQNFYNEWAPICAAFAEIKSFIVKARKPRTEATKTPERTLDHTGSCPYCTMNVKLSCTGRIVSHGYTIKNGYQQGDCIGVGRLPLEVSSEGVSEIITILNNQIATLDDKFTTVFRATEITFFERIPGTRDTREVTLNKGDEGFEKRKGIKLSSINREIDQRKSDVYVLEQRIKNWAPKALPDGNMDHMVQS